MSDTEKLLTRIEAQIRAIHHYAGSADHPAMKARVDRDVADIMEDVRALGGRPDAPESKET